MSRIHSLVILGIIFSSAWFGHVASAVERKLTRRRRTTPLELIHIENGSNSDTDTLDILEMLLADKKEDRSVGIRVRSENLDTVASKTTLSGENNEADERKDHPQFIQTPRDLKSSKSSKPSKWSKSFKKEGVVSAAERTSTKSSKKKGTRTGSAAEQTSTKSSKKNGTRTAGAVQNVNEKTKKNQLDEMAEASALAQMMLTMSMSMEPAVSLV